MTQDTVIGITSQVTDVEGPLAVVSSMHDGGMRVVFSQQRAWVCDETPLKPEGTIDLRADTGGVQRMMSVRREQPVEQVEQIAGIPVIEEKRQEAPSSDLVMQDARTPPPGPTVEQI